MKQSESEISLWLGKISGSLKSKMDWVESRPGHRLEWTALISYLILVAFIMIFHEPWFDEAQSWQIAKCASIREILFEIPHYEGHPPLWHLVLLPFARLGISFEWGIKIPNLIINGAAVALLLWKSPFYRPVKLVLPFTFFLFYQYGVISRTYCLLFLSFMLCAAFYQNKNQKPFRFCGAVALLCLSSMFGMAIGAGICVVWLWELWQGKNVGRFLKEFLFSRTMAAMALLFVFSLCLTAAVMPRPDTFATSFTMDYNTLANIPQRLAYFLFVGPIDALFYDSNMQINGIISAVTPQSLLIGGVFFGLSLYFARAYGVLLLYLIPYLLFSMVGMNYFASHHVGIITLFFIFVVWCAKGQPQSHGVLFPRISNVRDRILLRQGGFLIMALLFVVPLYWSAYSSVQDILHNYGYARDSTAFIRQHGLDSGKYSFMVGWMNRYRETEDGEGETLISYSAVTDGTAEICYLDKNIFYNYNRGDQRKGYNTHKVDTSEETRQYLIDYGMPDLFMGIPGITGLWPDEPKPFSKYQFIARFEGNFLYKGSTKEYYTTISAAEGLLDELGVKGIPALEVFNPQEN